MQASLPTAAKLEMPDLHLSCQVQSTTVYLHHPIHPNLIVIERRVRVRRPRRWSIPQRPHDPVIRLFAIAELN